MNKQERDEYQSQRVFFLFFFHFLFEARFYKTGWQSVVVNKPDARF